MYSHMSGWQRGRTVLFLVIAGLGWSAKGSENGTTGSGGSNGSEGSTPIYRQYYTIDENQEVTSPTYWKNPQDLMNDWNELKGRLSDTIDLMHWTLHSEALQQPNEPYNRKKHFGGWLRDNHPGSCLNTRGKILIRDSERPVDFKDAKHCTVKTGYWTEPYTGNPTNNADDLQIDHVVPLKNAYIMGAWRWDQKQRCLYANYMGNQFHLLAVNGKENMSKGDQAPDGYMPTNPQYICTYLMNWLRIKLIWKLDLVPAEVSAIQRIAHQQNCPQEQFNFDRTDLEHQHEAQQELSSICDHPNSEDGSGQPLPIKNGTGN